MGKRMVMWPVTSRDTERSKAWPILENSWRCYFATIANYCCETVRLAILAAAWLFVSFTIGQGSIPSITRSQAVSRIADRTASQHLWGHVTSSVTWPFDTLYTISYLWSFGTKPLSLTVSEIFNVECNAMIDIILIRPLNKGQGHSFWYQSISYIWLPIGCQ